MMSRPINVASKPNELFLPLIDGTCEKNFNKMSESKQKSVIAAVFTVAIASGLYTAIQHGFTKAVSVSANVGLGAFSYATREGLAIDKLIEACKLLR